MQTKSNKNKQRKSPSPPQNPHCIKCQYNLQGLNENKLTCPECGHQNTRKELLANEDYTKNPIRFTIKCLAYPTATFLALNLLGTALTIPAFEIKNLYQGFMATACFTTIPYTLIQFSINLAAAARLTQIQIMHRRYPPAIIEKPTQALTLFTLHTLWLTLPPILICYHTLYWFIQMVGSA